MNNYFWIGLLVFYFVGLGLIIFFDLRAERKSKRELDQMNQDAYRIRNTFFDPMKFYDSAMKRRGDWSDLK